MARYHGKGGVVYMSTTGSGTAIAVASLTEWSLDMKTDKVETTSFLDPNKTYVQGLKDVQGALSGFFEDTQDALFDSSESTDGVKLYLYPNNLAPTIYFFGPAWLDASIQVSVDAAIKISANFVANGAWSRKP